MMGAKYGQRPSAFLEGDDELVNFIIDSAAFRVGAVEEAKQAEKQKNRASTEARRAAQSVSGGRRRRFRR
jgi:hypothetical protein